MQGMKKPSPSAVKFVGCKELRRLQQQACRRMDAVPKNRGDVAIARWHSFGDAARTASDSRAIKNATANFRAGGLCALVPAAPPEPLVNTLAAARRCQPVTVAGSRRAQQPL